jgi:hypothetical protein
MSDRLGELRIGLISTDLLLPLEQMPLADQRSYQTFFFEAVRQRGFPLHTASLWNALYFGWSFEHRSYLGRGLRMTLVAGGGPIPVGAFIEVPVGNSLLWGEVVYKEGRDPRVDDLGEVDPAASGARIGQLRARADVVVPEVLILDFAALGEGLSDSDDVTLARARNRHVLTDLNHKKVEARYSGEHAGVDDLTLFARFIFEQYGDQLFNNLLRDDGRDVTPAERWELLLGTLSSVDELARSTPGLRTFGSYHIDADLYREDLGRSTDAPFGGDALRDIANGATTPPPEHRPKAFAGWKAQTVCSPSYRAVGGLIREYFARGHGIDDNEKVLLTGTSYSRLVLEANLAIIDRIGTDGLSAGPKVAVRLDDDWQCGGVWRVVRYGDQPPAEARLGALIPLGMGYASQSGEKGLLAGGEKDEAPIEAERWERGWRVALRRVDIDRLELVLCSEAAAMLKPNAQGVVILDIGDGLRPSRRKPVPFDAGRRIVTEVPFPPGFMPGTFVVYTVAKGSPMLTLRARPLDVPIELGGHLVRYEFDRKIFDAAAGLLPIDQQTLSKARTLHDQITEVFRRRGRLLEGGARALRTEEVVAGILGARYSVEASLPIILHLQTGDFEFRDGQHVWKPRLTRRTSVRDRALIGEAQGSSESRMRRIIAPRMIPMRLRHYVQRNPSSLKRATYSAARAKYHMELQLPEVLQPGYSWVKPYPLGDP